MKKLPVAGCDIAIFFRFQKLILKIKNAYQAKIRLNREAVTITQSMPLSPEGESFFDDGVIACLYW